MKTISFSNAGIKNIAYATMFIDHFFAVVFLAVIQECAAAGHGTETLGQIYSVGRAVGRLSFVLFAFLATEGFVHTHSRGKYLGRLALFAVISEIPFDLAFRGKTFDPSSQNIFLTLFLGVLALTVWEWAGHSARMIRKTGKLKDAGWHMCICTFWGIRLGCLVLCCAAAYVLSTDYKYMGVLLIFTFYVTRRYSLFFKVALAGCVMFLGMWSINCLEYAGDYTIEYLFRFSLRELYGLFAFVPIALYDGTRGRQLPKTVCYGFYPVHLLLLYGAARLVTG